MLRFSANLGFLWAELPLLGRIAAAGRAGFSAVEMHWPYDVPAESVAAAAAEAGVVVTGVNTVRGNVEAGEFGLGALPGREAEFEASVSEALAFCRATGATAIHAMAGVVDDTPASRTTFIANLRRAADEAARDGVTLLLEAINPRDKPGYFYSRVDEAAEIAEAVGLDNVRLLFDVYHVGVATGDVLTRLRRFYPLVGHVQIAAVPSRAEPDHGDVDYAAVLPEIGRMGYAGWIGCEYRPREGTDAGLGWARPYLSR